MNITIYTIIFLNTISKPECTLPWLHQVSLPKYKQTQDYIYCIHTIYYILHISYILCIVSLTLQRRIFLKTNSLHLFVCDSYTMISNEKTLLSSQFSNNSEANASELLENCEEMFPQYCKHIVICLSCSKPQLHTILCYQQ